MGKLEWDKSAQNYYEDVISPIKDSVENPLFTDLKKIYSKEKNIVDLGCGIGELLSQLSENFKSVEGWDFSEKMIQKASEKIAGKENIKLFVKDISKIREKEKFDYILSINSILAPNSKEVDKIIKNIYNLLNKNGKIFCILPAMESYIYQSILTINKKNQETSEVKNLKKNIDFINGNITFEGETQKVFYRFEILYRFKKAGFKKIKIDRVNYDWVAWKNAGQTYYPSEDPPWDWYLTAEK